MIDERGDTCLAGHMKIVIAGGHGQIALFLGRQLVEAGHEVVGIIRKADQAQALEAIGVTPAVLDLEKASEDEVGRVLADANVAVFAAGAGPGSGEKRKDTVDHKASVLLANAAELVGVPRFIQISAMGVDGVRDGKRPDGVDDVFYAYLVAKLAAEDDLLRRDFQWTILRPGGLTNDQGTGEIRLGVPNIGRGTIPREDVASTIAAMITEGRGNQQILDVLSGDVPIADAVTELSN